MPPPPDLQVMAAECLAAVHFVSFAAVSTHLKGGQSTTLTWSVDTSKCPNVELLGIYLDTTHVAPTHSLLVRPAKSSSYVLIARAGPEMRTLGTVHINVDDSACQPLTFPASGITPRVVDTVTAQVGGYNASKTPKVKITRNDVGIDVPGILIDLELEVDLPNFPNPVVEVSATVAINVSDDGTMVPYYQHFAVDTHWPWWFKATGVTAAAGAIVGHFVSDDVSGALHNAILAGFESELASVLAGGDTVVTAVTTAKDKLIVTLCPPG